MNGKALTLASFLAPTDGVEGLIVKLDWSISGLGPPEAWPSALQQAVRYMLDTKTPMFIAWGAEQTFLYNDAYVPLLGKRHPSALGRAWSQVWPELEEEAPPAISKALSGESVRFENVPFTVYRNGYAEQAWFTFSYSPLRCLQRRVHGFYGVVEETTAQVLVGQQQRAEANQFLNLLEQSASFIAVLSGPRHIYESANAAYYDFIGQRDLLGKSVHDVFPELHGQGYIEMLDQVYATGRGVVHKRAQVNLQRNRAASLEPRFIDFSFQPLREFEEKVVGILIHGYDVTEHVQAEQHAQHTARMLRIEQNRLAALLDAIPIGIAYAEADGRLVHTSAANRQIWGHFPMSSSVSEYVKWKGWWADGSARHGHQVLPQEWALARALRGEIVTNDVVEIEPFDEPGVRKTLLLQALPIRDEHGVVVNAVVAQVDITDKIRSERALRMSEAKFRTITDALPQLVFSAGPGGAIDYYNEQTLAFTGLSLEQLVGSGWQQCLHPDDLERVEISRANALSTCTPFESEFRLRHHSGRYRWILGRALPIYDEQGSLLRWFGTCTDIEDQKQTENELRDARMRLEAALAAADMGTWSYDIQHDRIYADQNVAQMYGVDIAEADGGPLEAYLSTVHPDDVVYVQDRIAAAIEEGNVYSASYRVRRSDGTYRHVLARGKVKHDVAGVAAWLPGVVLDVSSQTEAEERLARSEAKFRRLVDSNIIGIVQYRIDGTLLEPNDAFLSMLRISRQDYEERGLNWRTLTPAKWAHCDAAGWEQLQATGVMHPFEKEFFRADGSCAPVYLGAANFEGQSSEGIAYILDLTAMKDAERALRESEAKFRVIANAMPQMVWSTRADGYHDYYNDQWHQFTGTTSGETDGDGWNGMFHPDDRSRAWERWERSLSTGAPYEVEYRLRHYTGQYRWVLGRALPILDESGTIIRWMGTCTDIHEQKLTQEALRESDQRKDEFLAMLAHELRNPLAPILAGAELLGLAQHDPQRVARLSEVIARQTRHMTELIDDLLDVSRVTRGLITLDKKPLDIRQLANEAVEQARPLIDARAHRIDTKVDAGSCTVLGDRKRLVQIMVNLLTNAAKYTPNHGLIVVTVSASEESVIISVSDNGVGMSEDLLAHAFELFRQGKRTSDRSQGGLGIGLALAKSLVELHSGTIKAYSAGEGRGSEFVLTLPRLLESPDDEVTTRFQLSVPQAANKLRILVVDDNADAAKLISMYLQMLGHDVLTVYRAAEAIKRASDFLPQVCLLDIGLPDMDGKDLARRLRQTPGLEETVFAALTGYGQHQERLATAEAGFHQHFVKPVEIQVLAAWLAKTASN